MDKQLEGVGESDIINDLDRECLQAVLSVPEAARLYNKHRTTIIALIQSGGLIGRQAHFGKLWFVTKRSCDERWPDYGR